MILMLQAQAANAQYFKELEQGYSLLEMPENYNGLHNSPDPLVIAAQEASAEGTVLNCLLELQSGMMLRLDQVYMADMDPFFDAQRMLPPDDWWGHSHAARQPGYSTNNGDVFLGIGIHYEGGNEWGLGLVCSYLRSPDGSFREVSRHELGHEYIGSVFVLDASNDGRLDVIASWMTGAGAGGGVDLFSVNTDGSFDYFGDESDPSDFSSSLWSAHGTVELIDWDNDGDWELQLTYPLFFSAAGFYYRDIVSFNAATNAWEWDSSFAPEYYEEQDSFYQRLYEEVQKLVANPSAYAKETDDYYERYITEIDGEPVSLVPFINEDGQPEETWIEELRNFVEGNGTEAPVGHIINGDINEA